MTTKKKTKNRTGVKIGFVVVVLIILLGAGSYLYLGWLGYQESAKLIEVQKRDPQTQAPYELSPEQQDSLFSYGYPEAFTILFYDEESVGGGTQTVRLEIWDYYSQGIGLTFINGVLTAEDPIQADSIGAIDPLPYVPELFEPYMSLNEVISAAAIDSYIEIPVEDEFIEGGVLYYANSLSFGLKDDQLIYLEAIALTSQ